MGLNDRLLNAEDLAKLLGVKNPRAIYARMRRAGVPEWRDPDNPKSRTVRWWESDVLSYMRRGTLKPAVERDQLSEGNTYCWEDGKKAS